MASLEEMLPRRAGETERQWLTRLRREIADTRTVIALVEATARGGITSRMRALLHGRILRSPDMELSRRALAALNALPTREGR